MIFKEEDKNGREKVTEDEERVLIQHEQDRPSGWKFTTLVVNV